MTSRKRKLRAAVVPALMTVLLLLAGAASAGAQGQYSYTVSLGPTFGGSLDGEPDGGLDHAGFLASLSWRTQPRTSVGVRVGSTDLSGDQIGTLASPTFRYATIAGEYRFNDLYYESGVFMGLGVYQLGDGIESDEGVGLTLGVTGDFPINERFSVVVELVGHYADLDASSTHATVHAGVAYHF